MPANGIYVKDLRIIADWDLKEIIIVDNSIISFAFNLSNGVPISSFTGQKNDEELLYMVSLLEEIYSFPDIRPQIDAKFQLSHLLKKHSAVVDAEKH